MNSTSNSDDISNIINYKDLFHIYRHELGNHISALSNLNDKLLSDYGQYMSKTPHEVKNAYNDICSILRSIDYITMNIKLLDSTPVVDKRYIRIFDTILNKFRTIYRASLLYENKFIKYPQLIKSDELRDSLLTDPHYLDLIIYNLLNNAIKYSFCGTQILVDCVRPSINENHVLSIIDYGYPVIKNGEDINDIFKLYYRSDSTSKIQDNGFGIGLYVCANLAKSLNYKIYFNQQKLSNYHIPFLFQYIHFDSKETSSKHITDDMHIKLMIEYLRLKDNGTFENILYKKDKIYMRPHTSIFQIIKSLENPTYEVKVEVIT